MDCELTASQRRTAKKQDQKQRNQQENGTPAVQSLRVEGASAVISPLAYRFPAASSAFDPVFLGCPPLNRCVYVLAIHVPPDLSLLSCVSSNLNQRR